MHSDVKQVNWCPRWVFHKTILVVRSITRLVVIVPTVIVLRSLWACDRCLLILNGESKRKDNHIMHYKFTMAKTIKTCKDNEMYRN